MITDTIPQEIELLGYTGRKVLLSTGEDRGLEVGATIDARQLLHSVLFERLSPRDRRLVVSLAAMRQ